MRVQEMFELHDRVAIITGGATHLGRAMTTALGELGAATVIASRRKALCERVAVELQDAGIKCVGLGCDVTDEAQVNALVDGVVKMHGRLDIMVCNAGGAATTTYIPNASIDEFTPDMGDECQEHLHVCTSRSPCDDSSTQRYNHHPRIHPRLLECRQTSLRRVRFQPFRASLSGSEGRHSKSDEGTRS